MPAEVDFVLEVIPISPSDKEAFPMPQYLSIEKLTNSSVSTDDSVNNTLRRVVSSPEMATFRFQESGNLTTDGLICGFSPETWNNRTLQAPTCSANSSLLNQDTDWLIESSCIGEVVKLTLLPYGMGWDDPDIDPVDETHFYGEQAWLVDRDNETGREQALRLHYAQDNESDPFHVFFDEQKGKFRSLSSILNDMLIVYVRNACSSRRQHPQSP